jgi:hypothetical protein
MTTELSIVVSAPQHSGMFRPRDLPITVPSTSCKGKAIPLQAWTGLQGSRSLRLPDFMTIGLYKGTLYRTACTEPQCLYKVALYRTPCTEPQCLYKGALYLFTFPVTRFYVSIKAIVKTRDRFCSIKGRYNVR